MTTAFLTHPRYSEHTFPGHPENAGRLAAIEQLFAETRITDRLLCLTPQAATTEQLRRVHTVSYLGLLEEIAQGRQTVFFGADTYALPVSYEIARLSAGASLQAVDAVLSGQATNALVAARPPGHHALPGTPMGFCLLANVALAARHAQAVHNVRRILIADYDVHHGNGTQAIFYQDADVLYVSTHQWPFYPGTGAIDEIGEGDGLGATVNVPLRAGLGDDAFATVYERVLWPLARRFQPELILVSAGFDCHWDDPIGRMTLTLTGYAHLSRELVRMAQELCQGRIVFVLEGGYSPQALAHGMLNVAHALLGEDTVSDPLGLPEKVRRERAKAPPVDPLIERLRALHGLD